MLKFADLTLDPETYRAHRHGQQLCMTTFQFELLKFLVQHPQRVFSLSELARSVWTNQAANEVAVRRSMIRLRQVLNQKGGANLIRTVRGVGYSLDIDSCH